MCTKIRENTLKLGQKLRLGQVELRLEESAPLAAPARSVVAPRPLVGSAANPVAKVVPISRPEYTPASGASPARRHQILFVDDSPEFLATMNQAVVGLSNNLWQIHA